MWRQFIDRPLARIASYLLVMVVSLLPHAPLSAAERPDTAGNSHGNTTLPQHRACAAFDLLLLTSIEDASAGPNQDAIADASFHVIDARRLCRDNRFGEAMDIYTRIVVEHPSERWLR